MRRGRLPEPTTASPARHPGQRGLPGPRRQGQAQVPEGQAQGEAQGQGPLRQEALPQAQGRPAQREPAMIAKLKALAVLAVLSLLAISAIAPASASAAFGLSDLSVSFTEENGEPARKAGSHPFAMTTSFKVNSIDHPERKDKDGNPVKVVDGALHVTLPEGFAGNPAAVPRCATVDFLTLSFGIPSCPDASAVGTLRVEVAGGLGIIGEENYRL